MKKLLSVFLVLSVVICAFGGCTSEKENGNTEKTVTIRIGGLKGPTSMGMVKLLDDSENGKTDISYEYEMASSADELTPKFLKGELDVIAVPVNLGSVLYNNSNGNVKMLAINTLGVLYIAEKGGNTVNSISDLKGKTVYATGKGAAPELALEFLLKQSGLVLGEDVNVNWKSEPTEIIAEMSGLKNAVAMLPEPFVTVAKGQLKDLKVKLDLTEEWEKIGNGGKFITAGLIARKDFVEQNPETVKKFLEEYETSAKYVNENTKEAALLVEKYGIVKSAVAEKAIPNCNIVCITGDEMKTAAKGYFEVMFDRNPKFSGGKLPSDDFYLNYEKN